MLPLSRVRRAGDFVFVSGTVSVDREGIIGRGDVAEQCRAILSDIRASLEMIGLSTSDIAKCNVYLADPVRDFAAMNEVYGCFFSEPYPTRTTVGAGFAVDALIEIEAVVYAPQEPRE